MAYGMTGLPASYDSYITDGPRGPAREHEVECQDPACKARWITVGRPDMGTVDLDEPECPECGGDDVECWAA